MASAGVVESSGEGAEQLAGWGGVGTEAEAGAGAAEEEEDKLVVCQRCYRLRNYGSVEDTLRPGFSDSDLLTPQRFLVRESWPSSSASVCSFVAVVMCHTSMYLHSV